MSKKRRNADRGAANNARRPESASDGRGVAGPPPQKVIEAELAEIAKRRHVAGLLPDINDTAKELVQNNLMNFFKERPKKPAYFLVHQSSYCGTAPKIKGKLVGLSLSGGGIRSASFCLGFLQSLYKTGFLRHVDYISSVSGGGYAAASFATEVLNPKTRLDWEEGKAANGHKRDGHDPGTNGVDEQAARPPGASFGLAEDCYERQPKRIVDLIEGGTYLSKPRPFFNRWLIGVVLIWIVTASGMMALTSLAAYLFLKLDGPATARVIEALGFKGGVQRAFFPSVLSFVAWMIAWFISYWRRGERATGKVAQWLLLVTVTLFLMAVAALLGAGDIDSSYLRDLFGLSAENRRFEWLLGYLKVLLPGVLGVSLLPYLTPRELIRSGTRPRNALEGWVFAVASRALLFGVPLVLFGWFAQENFSNYNEQRYLNRYGAMIPNVYRLVRTDFRDWDDAWNKFEVESDEGKKSNLSQKVWNGVNEHHKSDQKSTAKGKEPAEGSTAKGEEPAAKSKLEPPSDLRDELKRRWSQSLKIQAEKDKGSPIRSDNAKAEADKHEELPTSAIELWRLVWTWKVELDQKLSRPERWLLAIGYLLTREENDFIKIIWLDEYSARIQEEICHNLTRNVIEDSSLYRSLPEGVPPRLFRTKQEADDWKQACKSLHDEGEQLGMIGGKAYETWNQDRWQLRDKIDELMENEKVTFRSGKSREILDDERKLHDRVLADNGKWIRLKIQLDRLNWTILRTVYPDRFCDKATIFGKVVQPFDQEKRWDWFVWSLVVFLVSGAVVNMNSCSLHGFYKDRLASMWIKTLPGVDEEIPLTLLETTARGAPYHLFGATLNSMKLGSATARAPEDVFVFSHAYCGSNRTGYVPTEQFARGRYDLASAVSLSGAALSPAYFQNPLLWSLMLLTNLRLGQWLPNPAHPRRARLRSLSEAWGPAPLRLLVDMLRSAVLSIVREPGLQEGQQVLLLL